MSYLRITYTDKHTNTAHDWDSDSKKSLSCEINTDGSFEKSNSNISKDNFLCGVVILESQNIMKKN